MQKILPKSITPPLDECEKDFPGLLLEEDKGKSEILNAEPSGTPALRNPGKKKKKKKKRKAEEDLELDLQLNLLDDEITKDRYHLDEAY